MKALHTKIERNQKGENEPFCLDATANGQRNVYNGRGFGGDAAPGALHRHVVMAANGICLSLNRKMWTKETGMRFCRI